MLEKVKRDIKKHLFNKQWRQDNLENYTYAKNVFNPIIVSVGKYSYGPINVLSDDPSVKLKIGSFCSIADEVTFLLGREHNSNTISTYPYKVKILNKTSEAMSKGDIIVGDDVWIGFRAIIMSGVNIGQGAIIAAGALVSKDVEPYSIVGGIPSKKIRFRFSKPIIDYMLTLDYSALTDEMILDHIDDLYTEIDTMELDDIMKLYAWFPKKPL